MSTKALSRIVLILLVLHAYIGWRLVPDAGLPAVGAALAVGYLGLSCVLLPAAFFARRIERQPLSDRLAWVGMIAMGLFSTLAVLTVLRDLLLGVVFLTHALIRAAPSAGQWRHWTALAVPVLAVILTLIGFFNARRRAPVIRVDVPIAGLPGALDGFSIAQISDIHVGPTIKRPYLQAIVDAVNALNADMVAVTGDLVDGTVARLAGHTAPLAHLSARHGAFFVTGNHEYYSGAEAWIIELERLGLRVLMNEHIVLEHDGARLLLAGITDYTAHHYNPAHASDPVAALAEAPPDVAVKVLLAHQPLSAPAASQAGFTLQLSGHTHGGQFFPWNLVVKVQQPFTAGLHRVGAMWIYISRGTGYWGPPKRLAAPSEITFLRLRRAVD